MKHTTLTLSALLTVVWLAMNSFCPSVFAQEITTANTSRFIGNGRWEWTVYIQAPPHILEGIESVEYTLHRTFPRPVQRVYALGNRQTPFGLTATGWGEFRIHIRIFMRDRTIVELAHDLQLGGP